MTTVDDEYRALAERMCGREVSSTRMFLYTLQIYFAPDAGRAAGVEIWCEPSWHIRSESGIVTGSGAIDGPSTFGDEAEVARASATIVAAGGKSKVLVGTVLHTLTVDADTHALEARFSGGIVVSTFMDDPETSSLWVLRDRTRDTAVRGTARGIAMGTRE